MTIVILRAETQREATFLGIAIGVLEDNHGYELTKPKFSENENGVWEVAIETPIQAADLMAHFHYTGAAAVTVNEGAVIISNERPQLPQDKMSHFEPFLK